MMLKLVHTMEGFLPKCERSTALYRAFGVSYLTNKQVSLLKDAAVSVKITSPIPQESVALRQHREGRRLTVAQMAAEFGVTEQKYKRLESGASVLTPEMIAKLDGFRAPPAAVRVAAAHAPAKVARPEKKNLLNEHDAGFEEQVQQAQAYWQAFMEPYWDAGLGTEHTGGDSLLIGLYKAGWRRDPHTGRTVFWLLPEHEKSFRENLERELVKLRAEKRDSPEFKHDPSRKISASNPPPELPRGLVEKRVAYWEAFMAPFEAEGLTWQDIDEDKTYILDRANGQEAFTKEDEDKFAQDLTDELVRRAR